MRELSMAALGRRSAAAAVARTCGAAPEFAVADDAVDGPVAACWRRTQVRLSDVEPLSDHLLSYCVAGTATCTIVADGVRMQARHRPRAITLLPAGRTLRWALAAPRDIVHLHLYLPAQQVQAAQRRRGEPARTLPALLAVRDDWLENYFRLLASELERCRRDDRLAASAFLRQTAELLIDHLLDVHAGGADTLPGDAPAAPSRVSALRPLLLQRVEAHVSRHLGARIRIEDLASIAGLSVDHFVRAFHVATGITPHQHVLERRLDHACDLLRADTARIETIARACGFRSGAHFSVMFRQHRGVTPSAYRSGKAAAPTLPPAAPQASAAPAPPSTRNPPPRA